MEKLSAIWTRVKTKSIEIRTSFPFTFDVVTVLCAHTIFKYSLFGDIHKSCQYSHYYDALTHTQYIIYYDNYYIYRIITSTLQFITYHTYTQCTYKLWIHRILCEVSTLVVCVHYSWIHREDDSHPLIFINSTVIRNMIFFIVFKWFT